MNKPTIVWHKCKPGAKVPTKRAEDAGYDLYTVEKDIILPKFLSNGQLYCDLKMHHPMVEWQLQAPNCCILDCEGNQEGYGHFVHQDRMGLMGLLTKNIDNEQIKY